MGIVVMLGNAAPVSLEDGSPEKIVPNTTFPSPTYAESNNAHMVCPKACIVALCVLQNWSITVDEISISWSWYSRSPDVTTAGARSGNFDKLGTMN